MAHNLEETFFAANNPVGVIQGCTIRKSNIRNDYNWLQVTCLTCNQTEYFENEYEQGKAVGFHFADKDKYPLFHKCRI